MLQKVKLVRGQISKVLHDKKKMNPTSMKDKCDKIQPVACYTCWNLHNAFPRIDLNLTDHLTFLIFVYLTFTRSFLKAS